MKRQLVVFVAMSCGKSVRYRPVVDGRHLLCVNGFVEDYRHLHTTSYEVRSRNFNHRVNSSSQEKKKQRDNLHCISISSCREPADVRHV